MNVQHKFEDDFNLFFKVQGGPTALSMIRGGPSVDTPRPGGSTVTTPMAGQVRASPLAQFQQQQQRQFTPSPRSGVYGPQQGSPSQGLLCKRSLMTRFQAVADPEEPLLLESYVVHLMLLRV